MSHKINSLPRFLASLRPGESASGMIEMTFSLFCRTLLSYIINYGQRFNETIFMVLN